MKRNIGRTDRLIRAAIAIVLMIIVFYVQMPLIWQAILFLISMILFVTAMFGFSLIYALFKYSTRKSPPAEPLEEEPPDSDSTDDIPPDEDSSEADPPDEE